MTHTCTQLKTNTYCLLRCKCCTLELSYRTWLEFGCRFFTARPEVLDMKRQLEEKLRSDRSSILVSDWSWSSTQMRFKTWKWEKSAIHFCLLFHSSESVCQEVQFWKWALCDVTKGTNVSSRLVNSASGRWHQSVFTGKQRAKHAGDLYGCLYDKACLFHWESGTKQKRLNWRKCGTLKSRDKKL